MKMGRLRGTAALAALVALVCTGAARGEEPRPYDPSRDPARDLSAAMSEARRDQRRVLLEVGGNWCGWCRELERFVRRDPDVAQAIRCAFVVVRVNVSPENANARFLSAYPDVPGYPYFFVLDAKGSLLAEVDTDDFLRGESYDRAKLLAFARKWSPSPSRPDAKPTGG
jgi:thiol:disulfide interchange protein